MCDAEHAKCLLAQQLSDLLSDGMLPMLRDLASKTIYMLSTNFASYSLLVAQDL